jgi:hypothetical protein
MFPEKLGTLGTTQNTGLSTTEAPPQKSNDVGQTGLNDHSVTVDTTTTAARSGRTYAGNTYVEKPGIKAWFSGLKKLDFTEFKAQMEQFKTERAQKHHDRLIDELGKDNPSAKVLKDSAKTLGKLIGSGNTPAFSFDPAKMGLTGVDGAKAMEGMLKKLEGMPDGAAKTGLRQELFTMVKLGTAASDEHTWSISAEGKGGVIFVKDAKTGDAEFVLKFDPKANVEAVEELYKVVDDLRINGDLLPFSIPNHVKVDIGGNEGPAITGKLGPLKNDPDPLISNKAKSYENLMGSEGVVSKFSIAEGKPLEKMSLQERMALLKNPEFAQNLGKSLILAPLVGLNDHLAPMDKDRIYVSGANNFSNLFVSSNGGISMIDIATGQVPTQDGSSKLGIPDGAVLSAMKNVAAFTSAKLGSPETIGDAFQDAYDTAKVGSGNRNNDAAPFEDLLTRIFGEKAELSTDTFFRRDEAEGRDQAIMNDPETIGVFLKNLSVGMLEGMEYVVNNQDSLQKAYDASGKMFSDAPKLLNDITTAFQSVDLKTAKQNVLNWG